MVKQKDSAKSGGNGKTIGTLVLRSPESAFVSIERICFYPSPREQPQEHRISSVPEHFITVQLRLRSSRGVNPPHTLAPIR